MGPHTRAPANKRGERTGNGSRLLFIGRPGPSLPTQSDLIRLHRARSNQTSSRPHLKWFRSYLVLLNLIIEGTKQQIELVLWSQLHKPSRRSLFADFSCNRPPKSRCGQPLGPHGPVCLDKRWEATLLFAASMIDCWINSDRSLAGH